MKRNTDAQEAYSTRTEAGETRPLLGGAKISLVGELKKTPQNFAK